MRNIKCKSVLFVYKKTPQVTIKAATLCSIAALIIYHCLSVGFPICVSIGLNHFAGSSLAMRHIVISLARSRTDS